MLRRLLDSKWTYYVGAVILGIAALVSMVEVRVPSRPMGTVEDIAALRDRDDLNVVFVLIDTLRADRLSGYGYERPTSTFMDDLASSGVRFAHVEAQSSWTKCSMASMWTSLYPVRSGVTRVEDVLADDAKLPAEMLSDAGFATAGIWRNGWVGSNFGFAQGFDVYLKPEPSRSQGDIELRKRNPGVGRLFGTDEDITAGAAEFLESNKHNRFFLYVHYMDVHQYVYDEAAAELEFGTGHSDAYDRSIHWVDRNVGTLAYELDSRGLLENTLLVIAADHGEGFKTHAEGHATTLYREVTEVPLVISMPFRIEGGVVVDQLVRNIDIWPTILDLLGIEPPDYIDGRSLVPAIERAARGEQPSDDDVTALAYLDTSWGKKEAGQKPLVSMRLDGKRVLVRPKSPGRAQAGRSEVYDHATDPTEQEDLSEEYAELVEQVSSKIDAELAAKPPWGEAPQIELNDFYREQLRALGYVIK